MSVTLWTNVVRAFRRVALPLASYYAITLAVPLANGAARAGDPFMEHAVVVILVPAIAIVLACTFQTMLRSSHLVGRHPNRTERPLARTSCAHSALAVRLPRCFDAALSEDVSRQDSA